MIVNIKNIKPHDGWTASVSNESNVFALTKEQEDFDLLTMMDTPSVHFPIAVTVDGTATINTEEANWANGKESLDNAFGAEA